MTPRTGSAPARQSASTRSVQRAREHFVTHGSGGPDATGALRAEIEASWVRSRQLAVDVDRVEPAYVERLDHDTLLARSAAPVLQSLRNELAGEPIGILLTDSRGTILERQCPDRQLVRTLDAARLAPGFVFAESSVGTNGIGTAIEMRKPTMVTGAEHYVESLKQFSCAAATIQHPVTHAFMGIIDFTATTPHANPLLLTFARSTAQRLQDQLLAQTTAREVALMRDYLAACHHTGGSVLALSEGLVMMNVATQQRYDLADQTALLAKIGDVSGTNHPQTFVANLPSGGTARLDYRPAFAGGSLAGGVVRVQQAGRARPSRSAGVRTGSSLPGLVGTSATWQQTCRMVLHSRQRGEWLVLEGEPGVGRSSLLRAANEVTEGGATPTVLDAADADVTPDWLEQVSATLARKDRALVLRHVDRLDADSVFQLGERLAGARAQGRQTWVAMTMAVAARRPELETELLPLFAQTVEVPPLRQHIEDLDRLVPHLLGRIVRGTQLSVCTPAMNQLKRLPWPGNVQQLHQLLVQVTKRRRSGVVTVDDLPAAGRAASRRRLSPLECLQRDAIVAALVSSDGSRERAAETLGISRATIYRRIKDYGIQTP